MIGITKPNDCAFPPVENESNLVIYDLTETFAREVWLMDRAKRDICESTLYSKSGNDFFVVGVELIKGTINGFCEPFSVNACGNFQSMPHSAVS